MSGGPRRTSSRPRRANSRDADGGGSPRERRASPPVDPADLARLLEPVISAAGMDLEAVRVSPAGRRMLLRLVVDADGGIGAGQIPEVSPGGAAVPHGRSGLGARPYTLDA